MTAKELMKQCEAEEKELKFREFSSETALAIIDLTLQLNVVDGIIKDAAYTGSGCAISQASASMMIDIIKGKSVEEALRLVEIFLGMIKKEITDENELEELEDAMALQNISNMPARVKCAVLAWHTLKEALKK